MLKPTKCFVAWGDMFAKPYLATPHHRPQEKPKDLNCAHLQLCRWLADEECGAVLRVETGSHCAVGQQIPSVVSQPTVWCQLMSYIGNVQNYPENLFFTFVGFRQCLAMPLDYIYTLLNYNFDSFVKIFYVSTNF